MRCIERLLTVEPHLSSLCFYRVAAVCKTLIAAPAISANRRGPLTVG